MNDPEDDPIVEPTVDSGESGEPTLRDLMMAIGSLNNQFGYMNSRMDYVENQVTQLSSKTGSLPAAPATPRAAEESKSDYKTERMDESFAASGLKGVKFNDESVISSGKKPDIRRSTTYQERNAQIAKDNTVELSMQMTVPSLDHIWLKSRGVAAVTAWIESCKDYYETNRINFVTPSRVSKEIRELLMAIPPIITNTGRFYNLSDDELFDRARSLIRPKTTNDFIEKMRRNVEFSISAHYKPTPSDFGMFLSSLLVYRRNFHQLYDTLAANNAINIPECRNKEGFLLKVYLEKIPYEYGERTFLLLKKTVFDNIHVFFQAWDKAVAKHKLQYEAAVELRQCLGGSAYFAKSGAAKVNHISEPQVSSLHHSDDVGFDFVSSEYDSGDEIDQQIANIRAPPAVPVSIANAAADELSRPHQMVPVDHSSRDFSHPDLSALQQPTAPASDPMVCLSKTLNGECKKPDCKYSHNREHIERARARMLSQLQSRISNDARVLPNSSNRVHVMQHSSQDNEA